MDFQQSSSDSTGGPLSSARPWETGSSSPGLKPTTNSGVAVSSLPQQSSSHPGQPADLSSLFALWSDQATSQPAKAPADATSPPVQLHAEVGAASVKLDDSELPNRSKTSTIQTAAAAGFAGSSSELPYREQIQKSFGPTHDLSAIQAYSGGPAAHAASIIGANGYASGNRIAFKQAPSLHLAAHEAAHIIQQRAGVHLSRGVGLAGDEYEQNADAIADRVVQGQPAADLLPGASKPAVKSGQQSCSCQGAGCAACKSQGTVPEQTTQGTAQTSDKLLGEGRQSEAVQLQPAPKAPFDCQSLLEKIKEFINTIKGRFYDLVNDEKGLQWDHWSVGDAHPEYGSVEGHQQQYRNWQQGLRNRLNEWNTNNCGDGLPVDAWEWSSKLAPNPAPRTRPADNTKRNIETGAEVVGGAIGLYLLYRGLRMLPSLLPPLWWTIPANAAIP